MRQRVVLSIGEQIYRTIREKIIDNKYRPGEMLNIDKLAEEFGVSTTPVREVLLRLEGAGLVTKKRGKRNGADTRNRPPELDADPPQCGSDTCSCSEYAVPRQWCKEDLPFLHVPI